MVDVALVTVTVISLALAAAMGLITWRVLQLERKRSDARVAALRAAAEGADPYEAAGAPAEAVHPAVVADPRPDGRVAGTSAPDLFAAPERSSGGRVLAAAAGAAVLLVAVAAVGLLTAGRGAAPLPRPAASPLELLSLEHTRAGGRLAVRGVVKNPPSAASVDNVTAVLYLFDRAGTYLGASRAPLAERRLGPGAAAAFEVPIAEGLTVGRYRVTFEADAHAVPHVDRRALPSPPAAPTTRVTLDLHAGRFGAR
jgi:hypothetical protein